MNVTDITPIANALIALIATLIGVVVVPWLHAKFDAEEMTAFLRWVEIGVAAAEQIYTANDGKLKKKYVRNFLKSKGYTADVDEIENAIESAVLKLHKELYGSNVQLNVGEAITALYSSPENNLCSIVANRGAANVEQP